MAVPSEQVKRCVIYARLSRSKDESVSIDRQLRECKAEARRRGWKVVGEFVDDGVSATKHAPEARPGWSALLASPLAYEAVLVWKLDRLARRTLDFLKAHEAVEARGAAVAAVADQVDMTTPQGRAHATMTALFAQAEADSMRARQRAARKELLETGRYPGGALPYGFRGVHNPAGKGWIIAQDPDEAAVVRLIVERTLQGYTLHSTMQHLNELGIPTRSDAYRAQGKETTRGTGWAYSTVDHVVRQPMIAGMQWKPRAVGTPAAEPRELLRGEDGLPVVNEELAIITAGQWYALQEVLAQPNSRKRPAAMRRTTSALLSGLMFCGDPRHAEPVRMYRATAGTAERPRPGYTCPDCRQTISNVEPLILQAYFDQVRDAPLYVFGDVELVTSEARETAMRAAATRVREITAQLGRLRGAERDAMFDRLRQAQDDQDAAERLPAVVEQVVPAREWDETPEAEFARAEDDLQRQKVLTRYLDRIIVRRGVKGAKSDESKLARLEWVWRPGWEPSAPLTDAERDSIAGWTIATGGEEGETAMLVGSPITEAERDNIAGWTIAAGG